MAGTCAAAFNNMPRHHANGMCKSLATLAWGTGGGITGVAAPQGIVFTNPILTF
jgi:hypothetical protein